MNKSKVIIALWDQEHSRIWWTIQQWIRYTCCTHRDADHQDGNYLPQLLDLLSLFVCFLFNFMSFADTLQALGMAAFYPQLMSQFFKVMIYTVLSPEWGKHHPAGPGGVCSFEEFRCWFLSRFQLVVSVLRELKLVTIVTWLYLKASRHPFHFIPVETSYMVCMDACEITRNHVTVSQWPKAGRCSHHIIALSSSGAMCGCGGGDLHLHVL